jgi:hypothetical protein
MTRTRHEARGHAIVSSTDRRECRRSRALGSRAAAAPP